MATPPMIMVVEDDAGSRALLFVAKPYDVEQLLRCFRDLMGNKRTIALSR